MDTHDRHGRCTIRNILPKTWRLFFLLTVLFSFLWWHQVFAATYDDFSSGMIRSYKWNVYDDNGFLSVIPGSTQPYVLHLSGTGSTSFPKGHLAAMAPFGGDLFAGINYFNFSFSGYTPDKNDPSNPSVYLRILGGASDNYFIVSRAFSSLGPGIGVREFDSGNTLVGKKTWPYGGASGALLVRYEGGQLSLGYSGSTNPDDWADSFQVLAKYTVAFSVTPSLWTGVAAGGGGSVSADVGGLYYWPAQGTSPGTPKWTYGMGTVQVSSPAIGNDGTIYLGSMNRNLHALYAINPDGTPKWTHTTNSQVPSSPAIGVDGTIYVGSWDGTLYAINPDGTLKWSYLTGDRIDSFIAIGTDGTIYTASNDSNLYAINPDGTLKWSYPTGAFIHSSPSIGGDGTIYVGSGDFNLYAINPDGTLKWSYPTGAIITASPAIGSDGTIYVGSTDSYFYAINPNGTLKWFYPTGDGIHMSSAAIASDGTIYVGSLDRNLYAINPDGTLKWSFATRDYIDSSPNIGTDGTIYFGSWDGNLYAIFDAPRSSFSISSALSSGSGKSPWPMFRHDSRLTGNYAAPKVLAVTKSGHGKGTITSFPVGIDCGLSCSVGFTKGKKVTLIPTPENNSVFTGWTGACNGTKACTVTMDDDITVGATFDSGSCTYTVSPESKILSYKGGTITIRVKAKDYSYCTAPEITNNTDWITYTANAFTKNKGTVKLTIPEYNYSLKREGTLTIAGQTVTITQKGESCALSINPTSSDLLSGTGSTGTFTVEATPTDCIWTALVNEKYASWIDIDSGDTGTGISTIGYTVGLNNTGKARTGKITVTVGKKHKSYKVKQGNN